MEARVLYRVGDACPEDHGGGAVVRDGSNVTLEWTYGAEIDGEETLTVYQVGIDDDATADLEVFIEDAASAHGLPLNEVRAWMSSPDVSKRAAAYELCASTHGWGEFDCYPATLPYEEVEGRWDGRDAPTVHFIYGYEEEGALGPKARALRSNFVCTVPDYYDDFDRYVGLNAKIIKDEKPGVLVGSGYGGAVVCKLIETGAWRGPTVLLASAHKDYGLSKMKMGNVPTVIVHGYKDKVVSYIDSVGLALTGTRTRYIQTNDGHRLESTVESGDLVNYVDTAVML